MAKNGYAYYLRDDVENDNQYIYKIGYGFTDSGKKYVKRYQALNGEYKGKWFIDDNNDGIITTSNELINLENGDGLLIGTELPITMDWSAINYYCEAYNFTQWFNTNVKKFTNENDFAIHKQQVIRSSIEKSLEKLAVVRAEGALNYRIPKIEEEDWNKILSNVSIITFMQGLPVGTKYYNNYAYATSTRNKEYVSPDEIYLVSDSDGSYHRGYCEKIDENKTYTGYRNIDFVAKSSILNTDDNQEYNSSKYYAHEELACYYCIVERANYKEALTDSKRNAYETALARERYVVNESMEYKIIYPEITQPEIEFRLSVYATQTTQTQSDAFREDYENFQTNESNYKLRELSLTDKIGSVDYLSYNIKPVWLTDSEQRNFRLRYSKEANISTTKLDGRAIPKMLTFRFRDFIS